MDIKKLKNFAYVSRAQMDKLCVSKEQMKKAFANALMNAYAKCRDISISPYDDSLVPNSILNKLSSDILSEEFVHVEVIGWLYQYFVDADRAQAVDVIGGGDIEGSLITDATQVFTPVWIVKYLTDNSLGKYFASLFGEDKCFENLDYYIKTHEILPPETDVEEITFFDPCCGSGNILIYAFDVYMKMYTMLGVSQKTAARLILEKNIFGADIDSTSVDIACFALMMKAAEYDKDVFKYDIFPNVFHICDDDAIGSLALCDDEANVLGRKYNIVCTNPPYLGRIGGKLKSYLTSTMKSYSKDLFTAFIYRGFLLCKDGGYLAYLTPNVWMNLSSHKPIREFILDTKSITSLIMFEKGSFFTEASVDLCAFTVKNELSDNLGIYIRLQGASGMQGQRCILKEAVKCLQREAQCQYIYKVSSSYFKSFPDRIMAFYAPDAVARLFSKQTIGDVFTVKQGMTTGNNKKFVRYWYEVDVNSIGFGMKNSDEAKMSGKTWFPYNKGGKYRKWYGNNDYVVMYEDDGREMKEYTSHLPQGTWVRLKSRDYYFKNSVTWSFISSSHFGVRYSPEGSIFDVAGSSLFGDDLRYVLGFLCTKTAFYLLQLINPTMNYQIRDVKLLPFLEDEKAKAEVENIVDRCIFLAKKEYDSSELSYDFKRDPLVELAGKYLSVEKSVYKYIELRKNDFNELKQYESRLNTIFAKIYGVEGVIDTNVTDEDITMKIPDEKVCVENLMSYIAGCAIGRYSASLNGVVSTREKSLNFIAVAEYARNFLKTHFFGENEAYIEKLLGVDINTYYSKKFLKNHFAVYRKKPIYTKKGDSIVYFKEI